MGHADSEAARSSPDEKPSGPTPGGVDADDQESSALCAPPRRLASKWPKPLPPTRRRFSCVLRGGRPNRGPNDRTVAVAPCSWTSGWGTLCPDQFHLVRRGVSRAAHLHLAGLPAETPSRDVRATHPQLGTTYVVRPICMSPLELDGLKPPSAACASGGRSLLHLPVQGTACSSSSCGAPESPTCVGGPGRAATFSSVPPRFRDDTSERVPPPPRRSVAVELAPSRRCSVDESVVPLHHRWCRGPLSFHGLCSPSSCSRRRRACQLSLAAPPKRRRATLPREVGARRGGCPDRSTSQTAALCQSLAGPRLRTEVHNPACLSVGGTLPGSQLPRPRKLVASNEAPASRETYRRRQ